MEKIRRFRLILLIALLPAAAIHARGGISGSDFLVSITDARPAALGGSFVACASGISSIFINPAGLALGTKTEVSAVHSIGIFDRFTEHFSALLPLKDFNLGFSATYNYTANFVEIDEYGDSQGIVANYDYILCASVSEKFLGFFSGGINFKYFGSYLYKYSKNGMAVDFGALMWYDMFRLGVSIQNLGTQTAYINVVDPMPVLVRTGLGIKAKFNATDYFSAEIGAVIPAEKEEEKSYTLGAECFVMNAVSLRAGISAYEESGLSVSAGAAIALNSFTFEYSLGSLNEINKSHRLGITYAF